jgi:hypothetical protein
MKKRVIERGNYCTVSCIHFLDIHSNLNSTNRVEIATISRKLEEIRQGRAEAEKQSNEKKKRR